MNTLLAIHWDVSPFLFHIGKFGLRWYSLLFLSGFIIGWYLFRWFFRREQIPESLMDTLLVVLLVATIVGARLGHCIFYQPEYYFGSWKGFWEIFRTWEGGLASHGGAIALLIAMWLFARKYGKKYDFDFLWIMDHLCIAVAFAGCMIRLGNLFNSEIYGLETTLPWGVIYERNGETVPKHPTQIYEALSYLLLGCFLVWRYARKLDKTPRGFFFGAFLVGCFGMRFLIEFIKEAQIHFESFFNLNMGQVLSIPFFLAGVAILVYAYRRNLPARAVHTPKQTPKKPSAPVAHAV